MMHLYDLGFYSGDEELLRQLLYNSARRETHRPDSINDFDRNAAVEISLLLEEHKIAQELLKQYKTNGITPFLQFRILQTIPDEEAYSVLAKCFDDSQYVLSVLEELDKGSTRPIYVYELGGLGDMIEGFMTIRTLLHERLKNSRIVYIASDKLARFLNKFLATQQITAIPESTFRSMDTKPIHALHLIAKARHEYGLLPRHLASASLLEPSEELVASPQGEKLIRVVNKDKYALLNLRSLAKLKPEASRKSYFMRSLNESACQDIIKKHLDDGQTVVDITSYPKDSHLKQKLGWGERYISIDSMQLEFSDYAYLLHQASEAITIDSMLTHLAASLHLPHTLMLAKGHDQRWIRNMSHPDSMYCHACKAYKQKSLHRWGGMVRYGRF